MTKLIAIVIIVVVLTNYIPPLTYQCIKLFSEYSLFLLKNRSVRRIENRPSHLFPFLLYLIVIFDAVHSSFINHLIILMIMRMRVPILC